MRKTFFLGAGFSKAINNHYPTLHELNTAISKNISSDILNRYYETIPNSFKSNIEILLNYLAMDLPWKRDLEKSCDKAMYQTIIREIQNFFIKNAIAFDEEINDCSTTKKLIDYIIKNRTTCITLNYDTLLEKLIFSSCRPNENQNFESFYEAPIQPISNRYYLKTKPQPNNVTEKIISIFKLHGSINWFWDGISPSDPVYCIHNTLVIEPTTESLVPYIIPPLLNKDSFYNGTILKTIWRFAHISLKMAQEIYIIGFSLPETDISVKFLLQDSLYGNKDVRIFVINTDCNPDLKNRYENVFNKQQLDFTYCCENALKKFIEEKLQ
jgi:hypothetical protein